ncbi:MAG: hypothetical protein FJ009_13045 [Chloroflexi bacterium]|nr:hypothetical protein [Chloroflexota bacterium]
MPFLALLIVLIAAILHAISNFLFKGGRDAAAMLWWSVTIGALWYGAFLATQASFAMPLETWVVFIPSALAEIAYARLITFGYADGALSQVYPIARGAPLLLIALFGALFLDERLPALGYVGIALLVVGIYLASLPSLGDWARPLRAARHRPTQIALLAALMVTIYTLLDKIGMRSASPLVYNWWVYASIAIGFAPFVWSRANRASTAREFRLNWRRILIASVATVGSYLAALIGLQMTAASYVGSVRATSVVMGALLGWLFLKEQLGALRVFAAALMVAGLVLIAVAR